MIYLLIIAFILLIRFMIFLDEYCYKCHMRIQDQWIMNLKTVNNELELIMDKFKELKEPI